jgi:hypothetical protein
VQQAPAATTRILSALTLRSSSALQHASRQTITNKDNAIAATPLIEPQLQRHTQLSSLLLLPSLQGDYTLHVYLSTPDAPPRGGDLGRRGRLAGARGGVDQVERSDGSRQ